jgi:hypothetical protein
MSASGTRFALAPEPVLVPGTGAASRNWDGPRTGSGNPGSGTGALPGTGGAA